MSIDNPFNTDVPSLVPVCINIVTRTLNYLKIDKDPSEVFQDILFGINGNREIPESEIFLNDRKMFEAIIRWSETMFLADVVSSKHGDPTKLE